MLREKLGQWHVEGVVGDASPRLREMAAVPLVFVLLAAVDRLGLTAGTPLPVLALVLLGSYVLSTLAGATWPDPDARQLQWRTAATVVGTTATIYALGWGAMVSVGYIAIAAENARRTGSRSVRPTLAWSIVAVVVAQIGIAVGLVPSVIDPPLVHGLALLSIGGLAYAAQEFATATAATESSQQTATTLLALANRLAEATTTEEVAQRLADAIPFVTGSRKAVVALFDPETQRMNVRGVHGFTPVETTALGTVTPQVEPDEVQLTVSVPGPRRIERASVRDPRLAELLDAFEVDEIHFIPVAARGDLLGMIVIGPSKVARLVERLAGLAGQAATALQNARIVEQERETVERLREADRLKSEFLAVVSHELRTPLAVMMGAARTLQWRGTDVPSEMRDELVESMMRRGDQLNRIVDDLLQSSGELRLELAPFDIAATVRSAVADASGLTPSCDIDCQAPGELMMIGDAMRVRQVVDNLITNAVKYGGGAPVRVTTAAAERFVDLAVVDTGPGMSEEERDRAFDPFWQADSSSRRKVGGIGLGLHITRRIIEAHGGTIRIDGGPGIGTQVRIRLPVAGPS